jgi:hypothetical protein
MQTSQIRGTKYWGPDKRLSDQTEHTHHSAYSLALTDFFSFVKTPTTLTDKVLNSYVTRVRCLYIKSDFSLQYTTYCNKIWQNSTNVTFTTGQKLNYWIFQIIRWYLHRHRILQVIVLLLLPHMDCRTNERSILFGNLHLLVQGHQGTVLCFCSLQSRRSWSSMRQGIKRCHNGLRSLSVLEAFLNGPLRSASVTDKAFRW